MKLLSVAIPCYNSADYMSHCIETLLAGGDEIEILIVNDGSAKDNTQEIAEEYQAKYPTIVKAVYQENKGHGGAVNTGLSHASGLYFKVVDSDDWVDSGVLLKILSALRRLEKKGRPVDMFLSNFVYDKQGAKNKRLMHYRKLLPVNQIFGWNQIGHFPPTRYILMHSVIYRTELLRKCGLKLPEHTFYVDNIFVFQPLPYVRTMFYMDVDFYHYFIGRDDQSVNEPVMISRIDQQIRVNNCMTDAFTASAVHNKKLRSYMMNYYTIILMVTSVIGIRSKDEQIIKKAYRVWDYLKEKDSSLYRKARYSPIGIAMHLPGRAGRAIISFGYTVAQKFVGFN